ncbi:hypothetical protein M426DRAFT_318022 [Hypoxylon sp. CI-4A]|nr:hypothetical protein M426DRAFT_318022 [Hypoxylon sp. CI-4A]
MAAMQVMQSSASSNQQQPPSTAPVLEFACLFTHDLRRKQKRWQDGRLKYHTFNKRIMVYDDRGNFIGDTHWREDYDLEEGEEVQLERGGVIVQVADCKGSRDQDLSELIDKRAQEKAERQAAALARRPPPLAAATTPQPTVPHFQLRHQPLHNLIGTPTGHHGRALIPTESPYEMKQKLAVSPQDGSERSAKRRKRGVSPPSKGGYAQSLFGAALTLSSTPSSTPSMQRRPRRVSPAPAETQSQPSSDPSQHDGHSDTAHMFTRPAATSIRRDIRGSTPRAALLAKIAPTPPVQGTVEPQLPSLPRDNELGLDKRRGATSATKQAVSNQKGAIDDVVEIDPSSFKSAKGRGLDKLNTSRNRSRRNIPEDASSVAPSRNEEVESTPLAPRTKKASRNYDLDAKPKPGLEIEAFSGGEGHQSFRQEQLTSDPRTELRIKPRKKRGLLMISDNVDVGPSPSSRIAKDRQNTPKSVKDTTMMNSHDDTSKKRNPTGHNLSSELGSRTPRSSKANDRRVRKPKDVDDGPPPAAIKSSKAQGRITSKDKRTSSSTMEEIEEPEGDISDDNFFVPDANPPPRLARLSRRNVRSKEVIGLVFDEEMNHGSEPLREVNKNQHKKESFSGPLPADPSSVRLAASETNCVDSTTANLGQINTKADFQDHLSAEDRRISEERDAQETTKGRNTGVPHSMTPLDPAQNQSRFASAEMGKKLGKEVYTTETTPVARLPSTKTVANPATRGKKAAKPSDAAGQVPQCPLPPEAAAGNPSGLKKHGNNRQKSTTAPMPGFSRANGGPWSREAYDLFEFTRPA